MLEYVFSAITDSVATLGDGTYICGTFTDQTIEGSPNTGSPCVVGTVFTVTLLTPAVNLYLHAPGLTTSYALRDINTAFVPKQAFTIIKDGVGR